MHSFEKGSLIVTKIKILLKITMKGGMHDETRKEKPSIAKGR